jgi:hypothetical protein
VALWAAVLRACVSRSQGTGGAYNTMGLAQGSVWSVMVWLITVYFCAAGVCVVTHA